MGLWDYLKGWDTPDQSGDQRRNASGAGTAGSDNEHSGVPFSWDMPPSPRWGVQTDRKTDGGYGHSADVESVNLAKRDPSWDVSADDIQRGYSKAERYDDGQFGQDVPEKNIHDRGSGSDVRRAEFSSTEGRGFDGRGSSRTGRGLMGSSTVKPGNQAD